MDEKKGGLSSWFINDYSGKSKSPPLVETHTVIDPLKEQINELKTEILILKDQSDFLINKVGVFEQNLLKTLADLNKAQSDLLKNQSGASEKVISDINKKVDKLIESNRYFLEYMKK